MFSLGVDIVCVCVVGVFDGRYSSKKLVLIFLVVGRTIKFIIMTSTFKLRHCVYF